MRKGLGEVPVQVGITTCNACMEFVSCRRLPGMFLHQLLNSVCAHMGMEYSTGYDTLWLASYICYHNSV